MANIGLTPNETQVYLALLNRTNKTPADVARASRLKRTKVYDLLNSLEAKGACFLMKGKQKRYEPVEPDILIARGRHILKEQLDEYNKESVGLLEALNDAHMQPAETGDPSTHLVVLDGALQIVLRDIELMTKTEGKIAEFTEDAKLATSLIADNISTFAVVAKTYADTFNKLIGERNIQFRSLSTRTGFEYMDVKVFATLDNDNYTYRITDSIPFMARIYDESDILLMARTPPDGPYAHRAYHIRDKGLAKVFLDTFDESFDRADVLTDLLVKELLAERDAMEKSRN